MGKRGAKSAQKEIVNIVQTSADVRPTDGISGGSLLKETDTGNLYTFDESTSEWVLICTVSPSGGGGNPNTLEVISSSLANPWGSAEKYLEYKNAYGDSLYGENASAYLYADASEIGFMVIFNPIDPYAFEGCSVDGSDSIAFYIEFDTSTGNIASGYVVQNGVVTDLTSYASMIPTDLYIIWHPLP